MCWFLGNILYIMYTVIHEVLQVIAIHLLYFTSGLSKHLTLPFIIDLQTKADEPRIIIAFEMH